MNEEKKASRERTSGAKEASAAIAGAPGESGALPRADHWSAASLLQRADNLRCMAEQAGGQASETLKDYPLHATMLSFRARDGVAELHLNFADVFFVVDGRAVLVTGGTIVRAETIAEGEVRGSAIDDGISHELQPGDVAHVPAGVPHQMLVGAGETFTSFVVKIEQNL